MLAYATLKSSVRTQYDQHRVGLFERMREALHPDLRQAHEHITSNFDKVHAQIVQSIAKHGGLPQGPDYRRMAWDGSFRVERDDSKEHGLKVVCTDTSIHIDVQDIVVGILTAVLAIVITACFPEIAIFAGFVAAIIIGVAFLIFAMVLAEQKRAGFAAEQLQGALDSLAAEAAA